MALQKARWQYFTLVIDHVSVTATTVWKQIKAKRRFEVVGVDYINVTGLVADATNSFDVSVRNGATVCANRHTNTTGGSSIAADTHTAMTLAAGSAVQFAVDDVLSCVATETGTATLPAGKFVVYCRYN
jgi:hypothetical protein